LCQTLLILGERILKVAQHRGSGHSTTGKLHPAKAGIRSQTVQLRLYAVIHTIIELSLLQLIFRISLFVCYCCCAFNKRMSVHRLLNWMHIWYPLSCDIVSRGLVLYMAECPKNGPYFLPLPPNVCSSQNTMWALHI